MTPKSGSKISFAVDVAAVVGDCVGGSGDGGGGFQKQIIQIGPLCLKCGTVRIAYALVGPHHQSSTGCCAQKNNN